MGCEMMFTKEPVNSGRLLESDFKPVCKTFFDLIKEQQNLNPNNIAFHFDGVDYTYSDLVSDIETFADMLLKKGIKEQEHVALWGYNSYSWVVAFLGIVRAGAVAVLLNYSLPVSDIAALLSYSEAKYIVYGQNREIENDANSFESLKKTVGFDDSQFIDVDFKDYSLKNHVCIDNSIEDNPKRTSVIMFTSGTTSFPKAVMLSQYSMLNVAIAQEYILGEYAGDVAMAVLPLFHSFGIQTMFTYLALGKEQVIISFIKPQTVLDLIYKYHVSDLHTVATVYLMLIDLPDFHKCIEPFVKLCIVGGALSSASHMKRLNQAFSNAVFGNGYGQTETSPGITLTRMNDSFEKRINTVGKPFPLIDVRIVDSKNNILPKYQTGEIVVKGYNLMNGYYKLPEEKQIIDKDGWLHTEDLGFFDDDGYLHFEGRIKDIIIKGGENITPKEVEEAILAFPGIAEVKVFGVPDAFWGEEVEACVVLKGKESIDEEAIKAFLAEKIAPYKIPADFIIFKEFPLNSNGKLNQRALKEEMMLRLKGKRNEI